MTDNDIIRALECCTTPHEDAKCNYCVASVGSSCTLKPRMLLDLIKRQQADIEVLQDDVSFLDKHNDELIEDNEKLKAEIERLEIELKAMRGAANSYKAENERLSEENKEKTETIVFLKDQAVGWSIDFCNLKKKLKTAKSEARKEFAERLKQKAKQGKGHLGNAYCSVDVAVIDELLEEMEKGGAE